MRTATPTGRLLGLLLVLHLAGLIAPFVLLLPLTASREYLLSAAAFTPQIRLAVFLLFANSALTIGISVGAFPVFRRYGEGLALWLLTAGAIVFVLQAQDNVHILSMLSLSQEHARGGAPEETFRAVAAMSGSTRRWAHLTALLAIDSWILLLYVILFRSALVPRALAVFGLATVVLHFTAIPLRGLLGLDALGPMGVPMAVSHLALGTWLLTKGFYERAGT